MANTIGVVIRGPLLPTGHLRKLVHIQGKTIETSVNRVSRKLRQLASLIESHYEMTKSLPEAQDDIKQMLSKQVECVGKLYAKLNRVAQVLGEKEDAPTEEDNVGYDDEGEGSDHLEDDGEVIGNFESDCNLVDV